MRVVVVPSTLALLPEYASIDDPVADLRKPVDTAVGWLLAGGPARVLATTPSARRVGQHLLDGHDSADGPGVLVVANGTATRTEKAPGHYDERAAAFDTSIGKALEAGDVAALARIDLALAAELWAPDAPALVQLGQLAASVETAQVDYDDAPYGVQYWVVRWQCGS